MRFLRLPDTLHYNEDIAATASHPSPDMTRDLLGAALPAPVSLLLDAPGSEALVAATLAWHESRGERAAAREALGVAESEVGVAAQTLRNRPDLRDRYPREGLDRIHDATVALHAAERAETRAKAALDVAASALIDVPETRLWLAGLLRDVADQYQAALDGFADAEAHLMTIARAINAGTGDRRVKQESLALDSGEHRKVPADNYRQSKRLADALVRQHS